MATLKDQFEGMRTFQGWRIQGRTVTAGAAAERYLVLPGGMQSVGLFREDQTSSDMSLEDIGDDWRIVDAADRPRKVKPERDPRDAMKIDYSTATRKMSVWTGPSKTGIKAMRDSKFWFSSASHRWIGQRDDIASAVKALHVSGLFRLSVTVDGVVREVNEDGTLASLENASV
jgi:hypothetical protein